MENKIDAILIHAYWLSEENNHTTISFRGKLALQAVTTAYEHYHQPYLVLAGGQIWGPSYPPLAKAMAEELREIYGIPKKRIIVRDEAYDTNDEINIFLQLAHKYSWKHIASLACQKHFWTIPVLYKNKKIQPTYFAIEDVLLKNGSMLTCQQVKAFHRSKYELYYALYQLTIRLVLLFDPKYKRLGKRARQSRLKKHQYGLLPFLPVDRYYL